MYDKTRKSKPLTREEEDEILWEAAEILGKRMWGSFKKHIKTKEGGTANEDERAGELHQGPEELRDDTEQSG